MIAFRDGVERFIDFATVGDRLFVNNVSLGVYATIVQQDSYRDAKLETSRELLPEMLGSRAEPFDLQFTTPDGDQVDDSFASWCRTTPTCWDRRSTSPSGAAWTRACWGSSR